MRGSLAWTGVLGFHDWRGVPGSGQESLGFMIWEWGSPVLGGGPWGP